MSDVQKKTVVDRCFNDLSTSRSVPYLLGQIIWKMTSSGVVINNNNNNNNFLLQYFSVHHSTRQADSINAFK